MQDHTIMGFIEDLFEINPLGSVQSNNPQEIPFFSFIALVCYLNQSGDNPTWIFRV